MGEFDKEISNALIKKCGQINDVESQWLRLKKIMMQGAMTTLETKNKKIFKSHG